MGGVVERDVAARHPGERVGPVAAGPRLTLASGRQHLIGDDRIAGTQRQVVADQGFGPGWLGVDGDRTQRVGLARYGDKVAAIWPDVSLTAVTAVVTVPSK